MKKAINIESIMVESGKTGREYRAITELEKMYGTIEVNGEKFVLTYKATTGPINVNGTYVKMFSAPSVKVSEVLGVLEGEDEVTEYILRFEDGKVVDVIGNPDDVRNGVLSGLGVIVCE